MNILGKFERRKMLGWGAGEVWTWSAYCWWFELMFMETILNPLPV